ncbi:MAG: membrane protein insertase YidC [Bacteroidetes bacterium]|nr:membrane protein insertase YidC [Bacteroidota bacterium]
MGLDRNTLIGISLICAIMFAWMWYAAPTKEQIEKQKHTKDSLELVQKQKAQDTVGSRQLAVGKDTSAISHQPSTISDSALANKYDVFSSAANDSNQFFTIENEKLKATISKKGGRISSVLLKKYFRFDSTALELFDKDSSSFGILFDTEHNRTINTLDLFFQPTGTSFEVKEGETKKISMRLYANNDKAKYIEYEYSLAGNSYLLGCKLNIVGMQDVVASNLNEFSLNWAMKIPSQEQTLKNQQAASTVYFKYLDEDPDYISEMKDETKNLSAKTKWVAFKQQFFTSVIIADDFFDKSGADVTSRNEKTSEKYIKDFSANLTIPYSHKPNESFGMKFYFGPNHYQTLKQFEGLELERQIPLGWGVFGWVNRFLVIPIFNFLEGIHVSYALIILALTLVFKILLFPVAYKTYVSSAKMKVLKPEIDEINKKFGKDDPMKKQQATMALYRKAGVSPLAGCIPALLQMPILIALVRFFPSSIELRQHGFWWVKDFSSFDSIWNFGHVPVIDFIYGDHVSVWALLCTITTLIYTQMNSQLMSSTQNQQMPGMKYMMYIMPVMFLPFLNKFSAGLSYYYTLANVISFLQMWVIRKYLVDDKKLHAQIAEHMKKPEKPKSSFQQKLQKRLEEVQKSRNGTSQKRVK